VPRPKAPRPATGSGALGEGALEIRSARSPCLGQKYSVAKMATTVGSTASDFVSERLHHLGGGLPAAETGADQLAVCHQRWRRSFPENALPTWRTSAR